jgi:hypothetical protein
MVDGVRGRGRRGSCWGGEVQRFRVQRLRVGKMKI